MENLEEAIRGIRGLGLRGVSVTIPYKTQILPYLDHIEGVVGEIRAVNTIVNEGGKMSDHNTDWHGALEALEEEGDLNGKKVILLGAGGAARTIGFGLKERGCQGVIFNRSQKRAEVLASELGWEYHPLSSFDEMDGDILVNATSVGMYPMASESPIPKEVLKEGMVVMEIVYQPLRTKLLREAEERGCRTIDGLEMLIRQGASQFQIWTGHKPDIQRIREDLYHALGLGKVFPVREIGATRRKDDDRDQAASDL